MTTAPWPSVVYLHGFASSPGSTKAQTLWQRLARPEQHWAIPDLQDGPFVDLTIDGMLERAVTAIEAAPRPRVVAGSSLGAYLAAVVLGQGAVAADGFFAIAPAIRFAQRAAASLGEAGLAAWRANGVLPFHHYATGQPEPLGVAFMDSCADLPPEPPAVDLPTVIVHGWHDDSVPWQDVLPWASTLAQAECHLRPAGHGLDSDADLAFLTERLANLLDRVSAAAPATDR